MFEKINVIKTWNVKILGVGLLSIGMLANISYTQAAVPIEQVRLTNPVSTNVTPVTTDPSSADLQGSTLWQLYQQVQQLQQEIRELRGQLEAQQDGLDRTQKDLKNRYTDLDQRLENIKEQMQPEDENTPTAAPVTPVPESTPAPVQDATLVSNTSKPAKPLAPAPSKSVNSAGNNNKLANTSNSNMPASNISTASASEADKQAYVNAYEAYKVGGAAKAIKPMQQFIASYPTSVYIPNAYYWLGEFYLANEPADFVKAKKSFNEVVSKYPKSAKASTALYRVATITQEIDKRSQDAVGLMKKLVKDYPASPEAQYAKTFISTRS